jgi:hypothetical protein
LFEVFELEKFYKQRERRLQLRNRFEFQLKNVRDYLLGVVNNFLCCTFSLLMGLEINNCCSCRLLGQT